MLDTERIEVLTFDCYGTLIDWETGILEALRPLLAAHGASAVDADILTRHAALESAAEGGEYRAYRTVLREVVDGFGEAYGFSPDRAERDSLARSVGDWRPFTDTVPALETLSRRYRLGVVSNIDDDLFAASAERLDVVFDWIVTAEEVRAYKPAHAHFERAIERAGCPLERILHVAQSLHHDIVPARELGLATVWVDRRHATPGFGATPPASAAPDLRVTDLAALVRSMEHP